MALTKVFFVAKNMVYYRDGAVLRTERASNVASPHFAPHKKCGADCPTLRLSRIVNIMLQICIKYSIGITMINKNVAKHIKLQNAIVFF